VSEAEKVAESDFSHLTSSGHPRMVDVSEKASTVRTASAQARLSLPPAVQERLSGGANEGAREIFTPKGPVFQVSRVAGIMAAKRTSSLIPMCHPIGLEDCTVDIKEVEPGELLIECHTTVTHKTGVEMEALTGVTVAALTIYDMCKGISRGIVISDVRLLSKSGGKSGDYRDDGA